MTTFSLEDRIQQEGGAVHMLRNLSAAYPFPGVAQYSNWRDEQESWSTAACLIDLSYHMTDLYLKGPDVVRLLSDTGVNSFANFGKDKAKQFIAVNEDGYMIGDAILFGLDKDEVSVVGTPTVPNWLTYQAVTGGYDVEIVRDERTVENPEARLTYRYEITGPNAMKVLEKAHGGPIERIKFFNIGSFTIAGCRVRALNHSMTVVPGSDMTGLEVFGPVEHREMVLDAILAAGEEFGLRRGGTVVTPTGTTESGWIGSPVAAIYSGEQMRPYRQWLSGNSFEAFASIGGSFASDDIQDYYIEPWDLGYGNSIKFDHDFIGRSALEKSAGNPHRKKVWLHWHDDDVVRVIASSLYGGKKRAKYLDAPVAVYAFSPYDKVLRGDRLAGISTWNAYSVNMAGWWSLALIDEADAQDGTEVTLVWGEEDGGTAKGSVEKHVQTEIRATISTHSPVLRG